MKKAVRKFTAFIMSILVTGCIVPPAIASANTSEPFAITVEMKESDGEIFTSTAEIAFDLYTATLSSCDPQTGLNQYEETYYDTVSINISDITTVVRPSACFSISPKLETIPEGYGISTTNIFVQEGTEGAVFSLSPINNVEVNFDEVSKQQQVTLLNEENDEIFAEYTISPTPVSANIKKTQFLSTDTLTATGSVLASGKSYSYTSRLDLTGKSKEERITLAAQSELLTEEEQIDAYCDMFLCGDLDGECVTDILLKIRTYYDSHTDISQNLRQKIETVFRRPDAPPSYPLYSYIYKQIHLYFWLFYDTL